MPFMVGFKAWVKHPDLSVVHLLERNGQFESIGEAVNWFAKEAQDSLASFHPSSTKRFRILTEICCYAVQPPDDFQSPIYDNRLVDSDEVAPDNPSPSKKRRRTGHA